MFEEHNLNRQTMSSIPVLGRYKVEVASDRVGDINPAVDVIPIIDRFSSDNAGRFLDKTDAAVDALDSIPVRLELADCCTAMKIPLIHGSVAGWYGQVAIQFPGDRMLQRIYNRSTDHGIEQELGIPSFTPAVIASIEAAACCQVLLDKGKPLRGRLLAIDLREMTFNEIVFSDEG
jgi:molybdopterin/thiamine biosynthesis adenylyltransferase